MSAAKRKLFLCLIGLMAGLAGWSLLEVLLTFQENFGRYLIFFVALGAGFGAVTGAFFGSYEGIAHSMKRKSLMGAITGLVTGAIGGAVAFLVGQQVLFLLGERITQSLRDYEEIALPLSRVISWTLLGAMVGMTEGIRARSLKKMFLGKVGGFLGGLLGGAALELLAPLVPNPSLSRLLGLTLLGFAIGLFYSLLEGRAAQGAIRLLNGKHKGKEYLLVQNKITIGSAPGMEIQLHGYTGVANQHAIIALEGDQIFIRQASEKAVVLVNEKKVLAQPLRFEDVIQIGSAKFLFYHQ